MDWVEVVKVMAINAAIVHQSEAEAANAARARIKELEGVNAALFAELTAARAETERLKALNGEKK